MILRNSAAAITDLTTDDAPHLHPAAVLAVFLCGTCAFLDLYATQPLLPLLQHLFRTTESHVSLTVSACTTGVALAAIVLALFGERLPRKPTIVTGMLALAVITLGAATARTLNQLIVWRLLQGLATPGIFTITIAYVTEEWAASLVPRVMSVYVAGTVFGGFTGRFLGGLIAGHSSWHAAFYTLAALGFAGAALTQALLPPSRDRLLVTNAELAAEQFQAELLAQLAAETGNAPSALGQFVANLRNPRLAATFGIGFCGLFTLVATFDFITFYLDSAPFNLSTTQIGALFAVYLVGLVATLAVGGRLQRFGLRAGMFAALATIAVGLALTLVPHLAVIATGLALVSSGLFIAQTCANSFIREAAPLGSRVSATGTYITAYYLGGTAGSLVPAVVFRHYGWPGCTALLAAVLVIAAITTALGWRAASLTARPFSP